MMSYWKEKFMENNSFKQYVILTIKKEEIPCLLSIANKNDIKLYHAEMFHNATEDLHRVAYKDGLLGGIVSTVCLYFADKNRKYKWIEINDLKGFIELLEKN